MAGGRRGQIPGRAQWRAARGQYSASGSVLTRDHNMEGKTAKEYHMKDKNVKKLHVQVIVSWLFLFKVCIEILISFSVYLMILQLTVCLTYLFKIYYYLYYLKCQFFVHSRISFVKMLQN